MAEKKVQKSAIATRDIRLLEGEANLTVINAVIKKPEPKIIDEPRPCDEKSVDCMGHDVNVGEIILQSEPKSTLDLMTEMMDDSESFQHPSPHPFLLSDMPASNQAESVEPPMEIDLLPKFKDTPHHCNKQHDFDHKTKDRKYKTPEKIEHDETVAQRRNYTSGGNIQDTFSQSNKAVGIQDIFNPSTKSGDPFKKSKSVKIQDVFNQDNGSTPKARPITGNHHREETSTNMAVVSSKEQLTAEFNKVLYSYLPLK